MSPHPSGAKMPQRSIWLPLEFWGMEQEGDVSQAGGMLRTPCSLRCIISTSHVPLGSPFPKCLSLSLSLSSALVHLWG